MNEYISKNLSVLDLESELIRLIAAYNSLRETYLFVYAAATEKQIPSVSLEQSDFYIFRDLLSDQKGHDKIDVYLETRGGSGETAEEIGNFLHNNFDEVSFVISGEAKSAGTIIALSGDDILMTETGSLGPIDAQMKIGRSVSSAHDYMEWVGDKRDEATKTGALNPFDVIVIAQISPGELSGVNHALKFAEDLVIDWLPRYKFGKWTVTETRQLPVTDSMKQRRAKEIASELTDHSKWRSHGRSIKIGDLDDIGLKVTKIDDEATLADTVYRIQTVCRLLFEKTPIFKIFATQDNKIFRRAVPVGESTKIPQTQVPDVIQFDQKCPQCGKTHKIYAKFIDNSQIDTDFQKKGCTAYPSDDKIACDCGFEIDVSGIKGQIEAQTKRRIITK